MRRASTIASAALVVGGLAMVALYVPFTLTHGPTSINEERALFGWDMHMWGLLLAVVPNLLIGAGLWALADRLRETGRSVLVAFRLLSGALLASAGVDLAFGALGPPFALFLGAPAAAGAAATFPVRGHGDPAVRRILSLLAATLFAGLAVSLVPLTTSDSFGGYRVYGALVHVVGGLLWAAMGVFIVPGDASTGQVIPRRGAAGSGRPGRRRR